MNPTLSAQLADKIAKQIQSLAPCQSPIGIILGSGLGPIANQVDNATVIPYSKLEGLAESTAPGHEGNLVVGQLSGRAVVLFQGRFHSYEGYDAATTSLPVAILSELKSPTLITTCAAGGLNLTQNAGDIMVIEDQINFSGTNPLIGPNPEEAGPRFPVMFDAYHPDYISLAHEVALDLGIRLHEGVYCGIQGPAFFTKAELRMLKQWGADALGMSIVSEVILAAHRGLKTLGLALISDIANPEHGHHSDEQEILANVAAASAKIQSLVLSFIEKLK